MTINEKLQSEIDPATDINSPADLAEYLTKIKHLPDNERRTKHLEAVLILERKTKNTHPDETAAAMAAAADWWQMQDREAARRKAIEKAETDKAAARRFYSPEAE